MGGMEFNKIFAAVLVAGIVAMLGGFVAKQVIHAPQPEKQAFTIEAMEESAGGGAAGPTGPQPILAMLEAADAAKGEKIAKACAACHTLYQGRPERRWSKSLWRCRRSQRPRGGLCLFRRAAGSRR
jgi:cytochrome c